jgi:hypothetical protein
MVFLPAFPKKQAQTPLSSYKNTDVLGKTLSSEALHRNIQQVSWLSTYCLAAPSHKTQWLLRQAIR